LASGAGTVVAHWPWHPKVKGFSPTATAGIRGERMALNQNQTYSGSFIGVIKQ